MRVIMFDRQSLFIHGAIHSLQKLIPEINITGSCQAEDLWAQISASPTAIVMIDGNLIEDEGIAWLEAIMQRFPTIRVVMVLAKKEARWVEQLLQRNVMAIVPRNAHPERFSAVLDSVSRGMVCFPGEWVRQPSAPQALLSLSERQREVLKLLGGGGVQQRDRAQSQHQRRHGESAPGSAFPPPGGEKQNPGRDVLYPATA